MQALGWENFDLARASKLSEGTISRFLCRRTARGSTHQKIEKCLLDHGVEFTWTLKRKNVGCTWTTGVNVEIRDVL